MVLEVVAFAVVVVVVVVVVVAVVVVVVVVVVDVEAAAVAVVVCVDDALAAVDGLLAPVVADILEGAADAVKEAHGKLWLAADRRTGYVQEHFNSIYACIKTLTRTGLILDGLYSLHPDDFQRSFHWEIRVVGGLEEV